jgi:hypothetical protein
MKADELIEGLPGEALMREGLADFRSGRWTIGSYLVAIALPRLSRAGLINHTMPLPIEPELQLYRLLRQQGGDAYSRYNSLLRELVSFEFALDHRTKSKN